MAEIKHRLLERLVIWALETGILSAGHGIQTLSGNCKKDLTTCLERVKNDTNPVLIMRESSADKRLNRKIENLMRSWQCPSCRQGDYSKCVHTEKEMIARGGPVIFIEDAETGKRKYFCQMACVLLQLKPSERKYVTESQFNSEGHYDRLRVSLNNYRPKRRRKS